MSDHELCCRVLELGLVYDQLNPSELATFELIARRAQLTEWRYRDRIVGNFALSVDENEYLFMGVGDTRGLLMICPDLQEFIAAELHKESATLKEQRKIREERVLAAGPSQTSSHAVGDATDPDRQQLLTKIERQADQISKLQAKLTKEKDGVEEKGPRGRGRGGSK